MVIENKNASYLSHYKSIIVEKCAKLSRNTFEIFKGIGRANKYFLYEGELYTNSSEFVISKSFFEAMEEGETYTIINNGIMTFAADVEIEDVAAIKKLYNSGVLQLPKGIDGYIKKISENTGTITMYTIRKYC